MTCIVGLIDNGKVYLGGDSASVSRYDIRQASSPKVFRNGNMIFGVCGSFRALQLLQYSLSIPEHSPRKDTYAYMVTDFIDAIKDCFKKAGFQQTIDSQDRAKNAWFLVGYKGRLFYIQPDYQVHERADEFVSTGCGEDYALGVLYQLRKTSMAPKTKLQKAMEAAEYFSAGVCKPFNFISA